MYSLRILIHILIYVYSFMNSFMYTHSRILIHILIHIFNHVLISYTHSIYSLMYTYSYIHLRILIHVFLFLYASSLLRNWNQSNRIIQTKVMAFSCQTSRFTRITLETVCITNFSGVLTSCLTLGLCTHLNLRC